MNKLAFLAVAVLVVVGGASAQNKAQTAAKPKTKMVKAAIPAKISCAVNKGDMVDVAKATKDHMYADYKGRRYFFCCTGCPEEFKKDPAKFAKAPSIATPKK